MSPSVPTSFSSDKALFYKELSATIQSVIDPTLTQTGNLANISSVLFYALNDTHRHINWCGFYLTENLTTTLEPDSQQRKQRLTLGPFQGRVACTQIPFGKGVCGKAAAERTVQVVSNVHEFEGHIACDSMSMSELVVPLVGANGKTGGGDGEEGLLLGVLDVDCLDVGGFDEIDVDGMKRIAEIIVTKVLL
jgi:L-methionine (R)-S-oxide reductase